MDNKTLLDQAALALHQSFEEDRAQAQQAASLISIASSLLVLARNSDK